MSTFITKYFILSLGDNKVTSMEVSHNRYHNWAGLVRTHLGRRMMKHTKALMCCIQAVAIDLKPSLLFDYGHAEPRNVWSFINELYASHLIETSLNVVVLNGDTLICNPQSLRARILTPDYLRSIIFVDVSECVKQPSILERKSCGVSDVIDTLTALHLTDEASLYIEPLIDEHVNITTLFGIILGYPCVYWYQISDHSCENCLSFEPLKVFKVFVNIVPDLPSATLKLGNDDVSESIYSFSVPEVVFSVYGVADKIGHWFEHLKKNVNWPNMFRDIKIESNSVTLPAVVL